MARISLLMQAGLVACTVAAVPALAQGVAQDQTAPPSEATAPPSGATAAPRAGVQRFIERFQEANTTGDGHLTLEQAQAARMPMIVRNFAAIDAQHKGYVTLQDIRAWRQEMRAERQGGNRASE